jgi:DNA-binding MarR family transcriptional regulator
VDTVKEFVYFVKREAVMGSHADGFLIGSLLGIPYDMLGKRVEEGYLEAGFADLRPAHSPVFRFLSPDGDRVTDLARRAGTTKQAMGYLVEYLIGRGYLERLPDPTDGRAQIVRRTARGWAVNRTAREVVAAVQAEWAAAIGEARMSVLLDVLRDLVAALGVDYAGSVSEVSTRTTDP